MKLDNKSKKIFFFLGLGLGIILVNIIYLIKPNNQEIELTEEQIIEKAEDLGMVFVKDNIKIENESSIDKKVEENISEEEDENIEESSEEKVEGKKDIEDNKAEITIRVEDGDGLSDITNKLINSGIIEDGEKFKEKVYGLKMEKKLRTGEFHFQKGESYEEIIKKLIKKN